jgi:drug/metabolite transporter (DMT)-like permease
MRLNQWRINDMTKPLSIFLELVGAIFVIGGLANQSGPAAIIGICMFLAGAIGIRKRIKKS